MVFVTATKICKCSRNNFHIVLLKGMVTFLTWDFFLFVAQLFSFFLPILVALWEN